eukprot:821446-Amphidinium_carterae.1
MPFWILVVRFCKRPGFLFFGFANVQKICPNGSDRVNTKTLVKEMCAFVPLPTLWTRVAANSADF